MDTVFVKALFDIDCEWEGIPPIYRVYFAGELFTERTWIWQDDFYLCEEIQIEAEPGEYNISYELVPPNLAELLVTMPVVDYGPAVITKDGRLRIENAPA